MISIPDEAALWRLEFFGTRGRLAGKGVIGQVDGGSVDALLGQPFTLLTPDTKNPYRQLYTVL